jgi:hypothetical protein
MTSDLPGETGALDPGLDQLFRVLTATATPAELAGEQDALAMFRANVRPPASPAPAPGRPAASPAGSGQSARRLRFPVRWSLRLATAATLALGGGAAAAAYAAVLPAPVQHVAHSVLGFAGVPDNQQNTSVPGPGKSRRHAGLAGSHRGTHPHGSSTPPASTRAGSPSPSPSGAASPPPLAGSLLSATAASTRITAGSTAVIDGMLTRSGSGVPGVTVTLVERPAGQLTWHKVGTGQTTADGNVAISVAALTENAVFRLTIPGAAHSSSVAVVVRPPITAVLDVGATAQDTLVVSTQYAHVGNVVVLQVRSADGSWLYLRSKRLDASGQTSFLLSATRLKNREVRVVLHATVRHGAAVSSPVTVPPPG